jgi:outer membrane protein assembly factor BamB
MALAITGVKWLRVFMARVLPLSALLVSMALGTACGVARVPVAGPTATTAPDRPPATVYLSGVTFPSESSGLGVGFVAALNPADGSIRWSDPLSGGLASADGNIYVQTANPLAGTIQERYVLTALRAQDGTVRWRDDTVPNAGLTADSGVVYLSYPVSTKVSPDHQLLAQAGVALALNATSGTLLWQTNVSGPPLASPVVAGASVYLALGSPSAVAQIPGPFTVVALDARTGATRWHFTSVEQAQVSSIVDGVVYVHEYGQSRYGERADTLVALDATSGSVRWRLPVGDLPHEPVVADGSLYLVAALPRTDPNGDVRYVAESVNARTGSVRWQTALTYPTMQLAVAAGSVYIGCAGAASLASSVHRVITLDAGNGAILWSNGDGAFSEIGTSSTPVVSGGVLYTLTDAATLALGTGVMALDARHGTQLWAASVPNEWLDQPIVAGGRIYALTKGYRPHLVVLAAQSGAELWSYLDQHGVAGSMVLGQ